MPSLWLTPYEVVELQKIVKQRAKTKDIDIHLIRMAIELKIDKLKNKKTS